MHPIVLSDNVFNSHILSKDLSFGRDMRNCETNDNKLLLLVLLFLSWVSYYVSYDLLLEGTTIGWLRCSLFFVITYYVAVGPSLSRNVALI